MDPADAAEVARRMRAAVVQELPRRRWVVPATILLILVTVVLGVMLLR